MRNFLFGILTAFVLLPIGILGYFALGLTEVRSDWKPSTWESEVMASAVRASVRRSAAGISNAATATHETLVAGGKLYVRDVPGVMVDWQSRFEKITISFRQSRNCRTYKRSTRSQNCTGS